MTDTAQRFFDSVRQFNAVGDLESAHRKRLQVVEIGHDAAIDSAAVCEMSDHLGPRDKAGASNRFPRI